MTTEQPGAPLPVTVVIPVRDRASFVGDAVRSALSQRPHPPREVIVVDDCSSDDSADVAARAGARVIVLPSNSGVSNARTVGIEAADAEWVALLDSDDVWWPHHLTTVWPLREGHVLVADTFRGSLTGRRYGFPYPGVLALRSPADVIWPTNPILPSASLVLRAAVVDAGGFRSGLSEDLDLWIRMLETGTGCLTSAVAGTYREHAGQLTTQDRGGMRASWESVTSQYLDRRWAPQQLLHDVRTANRWDETRAALAQERWSDALRTALPLGSPTRYRALVSLWRWRRRSRRDPGGLPRSPALI